MKDWKVMNSLAKKPLLAGKTVLNLNKDQELSLKIKLDVIAQQSMLI